MARLSWRHGLIRSERTSGLGFAFAAPVDSHLLDFRLGEEPRRAGMTWICEADNQALAFQPVDALPRPASIGACFRCKTNRGLFGLRVGPAHSTHVAPLAYPLLVHGEVQDQPSRLRLGVLDRPPVLFD